MVDVGTDAASMGSIKSLKRNDRVTVCDKTMHSVTVHGSSAVINRVADNVRELYAKSAAADEWRVTLKDQVGAREMHARLPRNVTLQQVCDDLKTVII